MKLTDKEKQKIIADYKECKNYNEVARRNHRSRSTIVRAVYSSGLAENHPENRDLRSKIVFTEKDWEQIEELCKIQCTAEEIASVMRRSVDTISRRIKEVYQLTFAEYLKIHSQGGKACLRRIQFNLAKKSPAMAIWLGKQWLGQRDYIPDDADSEKLDKLINAISAGAK